jgi:hypothetical protein
LAEARAELESIHEAAAKTHEKPDARVERLYEFLRLSPAARDGGSAGTG